MAKITMTQPEDWVQRWRMEAWKKQMDLAEWIGEACNKQLSAEALAKLSTRVPRGRPAKPRPDDMPS